MTPLLAASCWPPGGDAAGRTDRDVFGAVQRGAGASHLAASRSVPRIVIHNEGGRNRSWLRALIREVNSTISAVNFLEGDASGGYIELSDIQDSIHASFLSRVFRDVVGLRLEECMERGEAALTKLLAGRATSSYLFHEGDVGSPACWITGSVSEIARCPAFLLSRRPTH